MPTMQAGEFVLHTFKAEKGYIEVFACTDTLPASRDFRGQSPNPEGSLISASFSRLNIKGGELFQGRKVYNPVFIEENEMDFNPFPE
jgi:hypothetical protein